MRGQEGTSQDERWRQLGLRAWALIGVLILVGGALWGLARISSAFVPFGFGLLVVLGLRGPVDWLARRMPRALAVLACYVAVIAAVGVALFFIVPTVYAQITQFMAAVPGYVSDVYKLWDRYIANPSAGTGIPSWLQTAVVAIRDRIVASVGTWSTFLAGWAVSAGSSVASIVLDVSLAGVIGFYVLTDLPRLEKVIPTVAGERWEQEIGHALSTVSRVVGGWLRGVLIQSTIVAALLIIGLSIARVPYALALGVVGGIINVVPYVGPFVTGALVAVSGLFVSVPTALWGVLVVILVQQFDGSVTAPRIMAGQVGLHPLLVILALLTGATLFGVPGMVLAVPVAAVARAIGAYWFEQRRGPTGAAGGADGPNAGGAGGDASGAGGPSA